VKHIVIAIGFVLVLVTCKHMNRSSAIKAIGVKNHTNAVIFSDDLVASKTECRYEFINLMMDSFNDGLLRNGALTGLGTNNPTGKKMKADSAYFQALRVASIFDWELGQRLTAKESRCLPGSIGMHLGSFTPGYPEGLDRAFVEDVNKVRKAANLVNDSLGEFEVVSFASKEDIKAWPNQSVLPIDYQQALLNGISDKLRYQRAMSTQTVDEVEKLKAIAGSYNPLSISFEGDFSNQGAARYFMRAYLPPLYQLESIDWDNLATWRQELGIKRRQLNNPVQISVATLTHIGYLYESDEPRQPVIKLQMYKDYKQPDLLKTRVLFGRVGVPAAGAGAIPVDFKDHRDSLYISLFPNIAINEGDNSLIRSLKSQFNRIVNPVKLDARIHQLSLDLIRDVSQGAGGIDELMLKPQFSLKDSDISFRMHRYTDGPREMNALQLLGFVCQPQPQDPRPGWHDCTLDFGAYTDLRDFVLDDRQGGADGNITTTNIGMQFKRLLNTVTRYNVKFIVNWNIDEIEAALDKEIESIINEVVDEQKEIQDKVRKRLEERIFAE